MTAAAFEALEFSEFFFRQEMIAEEEAEQESRHMVSAAFTGWQLGAGKKDQSLKKYLESFNLIEAPPQLTEAQREQQKEIALANAEKIRQDFKAGKFTERKLSYGA